MFDITFWDTRKAVGSIPSRELLPFPFLLKILGKIYQKCKGKDEGSNWRLGISNRLMRSKRQTENRHMLES